ncbi:MAG: peptidylprolyl isomerase [Myxococcales bacterium]
MQILREPLVHFCGLGMAVFLLHRAVSPSAPTEEPADTSIVVGDQQRRELNALFEQRQGRSPSAAEGQALVDAWVDDELLFREALRTDLVRTDETVRDQLVARMRTLVQASAGARLPSDEELKTFFEAHRADYIQPAAATFVEYLVRTGPTAEDEARALVAELRASRDVRVIPTRFEKVTRPQVEVVLGADNADKVEGLPLHEWIILRSPRGLHVVRVEERQAATAPEFSVLHDRLAADFRVERTRDHFRQELARLEGEFEVQRVQAARP